MVPELLGYAHHSVEYWSLSPHSPATTRICSLAGALEDPKGSKKIWPSLGINPAHLSVRVLTVHIGRTELTPSMR